MARHNNFHLLPAPGPGLSIRGTEKDRPWYGSGCGICGNQDPDGRYSPLIPVRVRWYDPDDGWRSGVLCQGCAEDAAPRGPRPEDYAETVRRRAESRDPDRLSQSDRLDLIESIGGDDEDAIQVESDDASI